MYGLIILLAFNLVYANGCLLDEENFECAESCYSIVKPMLSYLPSIYKRLEACEEIKPPYPQDRLDKIESRLNQVQTILSAKSQCEEQYKRNEECDIKLQNLNKSIADYQKEIEETKLTIQSKEEKITQLQLKIMENDFQKIEEREKKYSEFQKIGSKYYYVESKKKENWFEALHSCRRLGSNLASPQNEEELNELARLAAESGGNCWLDIHDKIIKGNYMSVTTGEKAHFLKWNKGEPNHARSDENCVELKSNLGLMNDRVCSDKLNFICVANIDS